MSHALRCQQVGEDAGKVGEDCVICRFGEVEEEIEEKEEEKTNDKGRKTLEIQSCASGNCT